MRRVAMVALIGVLAATGCTSSKHKSSSTTASGTPSTGRIAPPNSPVAVPTVTGPLVGGNPAVPVNAMPTELAKQYGYSEKEYLFAGTATAYKAAGSWLADGKWGVTPTTEAPYRTRMVVRTPTDPKKFNGTVVVEWFNETSGRDADPDFGFAHLEFLRDGYAYVGVSAQTLGVNGVGGFKLPIPGYNPVSLIVQNPARYKTLSHPGDDYAFDIFSQAAQAIWRPKGVNPLGSLHPSRLIATGESQSASLMVTYANAFAPITNLYNGFMIHSRGGDGAAINAASEDLKPAVARIRADLSSPVMMLETETDLFGLGFFPARQPDTEFVRTWEMAGTAHADQSTLDYGIASGAVWCRARRRPTSRSCVGTSTTDPRPPS